ncbi:ZN462 protein, partial [Chordeiles acutipennis]|nr:ZN462 protein [Chordeiles acutipennis]
YFLNLNKHSPLPTEERVVPIEVCRSKLSKNLQGVVFRCGKCTFTCSSDESLQQHIEKHNELKPYKCQLCYYESKHTEELDTHLRDEHKVSRNFELVGQVNLDQLEQMKGKTDSSSSDEEEKELNHKTEEKESMMYPDSGAPEKCFPCEFCGRSFTEGFEWERHVLRHGMSLSESKQGTREDNKLKENRKKTVNTLTVEEKEKMVVDLSHNGETTVSVVAADKPLQETSEDKNE